MSIKLQLHYMVCDQSFDNDVYEAGITDDMVSVYDI